MKEWKQGMHTFLCVVNTSGYTVDPHLGLQTTASRSACALCGLVWSLARWNLMAATTLCCVVTNRSRMLICSLLSPLPFGSCAGGCRRATGYKVPHPLENHVILRVQTTPGKVV